MTMLATMKVVEELIRNWHVGTALQADVSAIAMCRKPAD